jgi:hypothetical protein
MKSDNLALTPISTMAAMLAYDREGRIDLTDHDEILFFLHRMEFSFRDVEYGFERATQAAVEIRRMNGLAIMGRPALEQAGFVLHDRQPSGASEWRRP